MNAPRIKLVPLFAGHRSGAGLLSLGILALYLSGSLFSAAPHVHAHDEYAVLHYEGCTNDPCHVAVCHPDRSGACRHKGHWSRHCSKPCPRCGALVLYQALPPEGLKEHVSQAGFARLSDLSCFPQPENESGASARGPPVA